MWVLKWLVWIQACLCNIVLVASVNIDIQNKTVQKQIFSDVLKNISLANQILQELISNYERLQDIYKSKELLVSDSSNSEIDPVFRFVSSDREKKSRSRGKKTTNSSPEKYQPATAMIYDDPEEDTKTAASDTNTETVVELDDHLRKNKIKKQTIIFPISDESKDDTDDYGVDSDNSFSEEMIIEMPPKENTVTYTPKYNVTTKNHVKKLQHDFGKTVKTRFSIQSGSKKLKRSRDDARRVKKVVHVESFSPDKIWQEIVNKPVKLNSQTTLPKINESTFFIKSKPSQKVAVVIVSKAKKNKDSTMEGNQNLKININKRAQTSLTAKKILRSAYGDACIVVAIQKCYKALKNVKKDVCGRGSRCKSSFKSTFTQKSKTGCLREFDYTKQESINATENITFFHRGIKTVEDTKFVDATRDRYLDTCIPSVVTQSKTILNKTLRDEIPKAQFKTLNILRDKYERRCKKLSSKKCNSACQYAYTEACSAHKCEKHRKKSFKKSCKRKCQEAYSIFKDSSSGSSSSQSESESNSN